MSTTSLWQAVSSDPDETSYPALDKDIEIDVAIIGGGITGLTTAQYLIAAGKKVAVLEAYKIGEGTTGNSTGNLYIETQPYLQHIKEKFGVEVAQAVADSRKKAIDVIEKNVNEKNINCNFSRRPWFIFANTADAIAMLDEEVKTFRELNIPIDYTSELPLPFKFVKAATMANQARINPLKYVLGLAKDLNEKGCLIFENTKVTEIDQADEGLLVTTQAKVRAAKVIIATHTPIGINTVHMYTAPYRSYVIATRLKNQSLPEGHFWEIGSNISSTHSVTNENQPEYLLVAGSHHKTGQEADALAHFKKLSQYLNKQVSDFEIVHQWSAQHYQSADDIPYIGLAHKSAKNTYMATGFFADGLIYGTIAAKVLSDIIINGDSEFSTIYNANRSTLGKSLGFLTKENANVFMQYLKDLPLRAEAYNDLKPGEGRIIKRNSEKWAVSRDEQNQLHAVSAVCTHMKCIVKWNNVEKTWDCPCHGSRFSPQGCVLEGPAISDLDRKDI